MSDIQVTTRRTPTTSHLAHESVKERKQAMYTKITAGLEKLRVGGTFEEIAVACLLEPAQVWKRLSEMIDNGTVYNVGITRETSSGRKAMVRQLSQFRNVVNKADLQTGKLLIQADLFGKQPTVWDSVPIN